MWPKKSGNFIRRIALSKTVREGRVGEGEKEKKGEKRTIGCIVQWQGCSAQFAESGKGKGTTHSKNGAKPEKKKRVSLLSSRIRRGKLDRRLHGEKRH